MAILRRMTIFCGGFPDLAQHAAKTGQPDAVMLLSWKESLISLEPMYFEDTTKKRGKGEVVAFTRAELDKILSVYGFFVASGDWKDYAIDFPGDVAVFSVFRRASEAPLYRIEKNPKLARKQGAFSVISMTGQILKRGQDLGQVLKVFDRQKLKLAT